jgi:hypothetical protein
MRRERTTGDKAARQRAAMARYRASKKGKAAQARAEARRTERRRETAEIVF